MFDGTPCIVPVLLLTWCITFGLSVKISLTDSWADKICAAAGVVVCPAPLIDVVVDE